MRDKEWSPVSREAGLRFVAKRLRLDKTGTNPRGGSMEPKLFVATKEFIVRNGKVLIVRESSRYGEGTNVGKFDVPGGRVRPGERFNEGLLREVREETGLTVTIQAPFFVGEWRPVVKGEPWQVVGIFFKCDAVSGDVRLSDDHDAYEWIDPSSFTAYSLIPNLHTAFETYIRLENSPASR